MKIIAFAATAFLITACGFHPVYGVNKYTPVGAETKFSQIAIDIIPDREGQYLRNALIDRFHRNGKADKTNYRITIAPLQETQRNLDVTIDADTTRAQLSIKTTMTLRDTISNKDIVNRELISTASYNVLGSEFTNRVSEQSTRENVLDDLARQIEMQVGLYFKREN